jgi:hypothetical protein
VDDICDVFDISSAKQFFGSEGMWYVVSFIAGMGTQSWLSGLLGTFRVVLRASSCLVEFAIFWGIFL